MINGGPIYSTEEASREAPAIERFILAMRQIEGAQNLLSAACANLSSIIGQHRLWNAVSKQHERVQALWYKLEYQLRNGGHRFKLDTEKPREPPR